MNTIFDKVDPKYLECSSGICGHPEHTGNGPALVILMVLGAALFVIARKAAR